MFRNLSPAGLGISGSQSELIELSMSHGYRGLDLDLAEFVQRVATSNLATARRFLDSARLKLGSFRLPLEIEADEAAFQQQLEQLKPQIEMMSQVNCNRAVYWIKPASDEQPFHSSFENHRKRLQAVGELLAPYNVRLAVGFQPTADLRADHRFQFIHDLSQLLILLSSVSASNVGLLVDPWAMAVAGNGLDGLAKLPAERIVAVHLSDLPEGVVAAEAKSSQRRLPGESNQVDCAATLTRLAESGYDGPVTLVADRDAYSDKSREGYLKLSRERFDQVWKDAGLGPTGKLAAKVGS
jgi:sugar phosphate isomerase/epimerase